MKRSLVALGLTLIIAWLVLRQGWDPRTALWVVCGISFLTSVLGILIVMALSDDPRKIWTIYTAGLRRLTQITRIERRR